MQRQLRITLLNKQNDDTNLPEKENIFIPTMKKGVIDITPESKE
jgi:hypothetical protein